jgi:hypothetical protein
MKKIFTLIVLPIVIVALCYAIYNSVQEPVRFNKEKDERAQVGIQRPKDIRTLQDAFKGSYGHFTESIDSLIDFYNTGKIKIVKQLGSRDDSAAVANTEALKKKHRKITNEQLLEYYEKGMNIVLAIDIEIPVKDTLLKRADFVLQDLKYIPFSDNKETIMKAVIKKVSGVDVPLFEACMPFDDLLKGMDHQLIVNLKAESEHMNKYPGLKVGSVDAPNNNAGNWE